MCSMRSAFQRLHLCLSCLFVVCNVYSATAFTLDEQGQNDQVPRPRHDVRHDAYPAPGSSELDKFASRVLQWHVVYCGKNRVCSDHATSSCYKCAPCQCDLACATFGDCCPDLVMEAGNEVLQSPFTGVDTNVLSCMATEIKTNIPEHNNIISLNKKTVVKRYDDAKSSSPNGHEDMKTHSYFMISSCPHSFTDPTLCDNPDEELAPVSANADTNKIFRNVHCAKCHGVHETTSWSVRISCENSKNISGLYTVADVISLSPSQHDCVVSYIPPSQGAGRRCYSDPEMVTRCNVTGKWTKRDSFLERACHSYLTPKLVNEILYKNVFCYMCNHGDEPETQMLLTSCQKKPVTWNPSMEVTLRDLGPSKSKGKNHPLEATPFTVCKKQGIYDSIEELCRDVKCEDGHQLVNGACQHMFSDIRGLGYELYFGLRPKAPIDVSGDHNILHRLPAEMEIYIGQTVLQSKAKLQDFAMSFNTTDDDGRCGQTSSDLGVYARLVSHVLTDQAELESSLLQVRQAIFNVSVLNWNMSFEGFPHEVVWHTMQPSRRHSPQQLSACVIIVSNTRLEQRRDGTIRVGTTTPDPSMPGESQQPSYIRLSELIKCPHVQLMPHEYTASFPGDVITLQWGTVLSSSRYVMNLDNNVTVCLSDFLHKLEKARKNRSSQEDTLAIVLLTVSIMCLLMCFIVFLLFTVLRSLSGKNNIIIVVCLCFSQISILVGYLVDDTSRICTVVGIITHYLSLCVFCSLIVSSFHVYKLFTTMHLSRDVTRDLKSLVSYCCFTFLVPIAIVVTVIAMHLSHKVSWRTIGYGGGPFCLLSSAISLWLALFLPVAISLIVAFVLFCLTCTSLHHTKDLETNQTDERHVNFYFRASLLASLTWIVGVPGIVTSLSPLRIVFITLQTVLGIYVFVSLVLTPRVTRLLSGSCCQSRQPPRGRTSLNMKMASSDDCPVKPPCIVGTGYRRRDPNVSANDSRRHPLERYTKRTEFEESIA